MPSTEHHLQLHCLLLGLGDASKTPDWKTVRLAERIARFVLQDLNIFASSPNKLREPALTQESVSKEIEKVDFVLAEITETSPTIFFYLGLAKAQGRPIVTLREFRPDRQIEDDLFDRQADFNIPYEDSPDGEIELRRRLHETLASLAYSQDQENRVLLDKPLDGTEYVHWDRLSSAGHDNLVFDLLLREGLTELQWLEGTREIDLIGMRPMPVGYRPCLVSIGSGLVDEFQVSAWITDLEPVAEALTRLLASYPLAVNEKKKILLELAFFWSPVENAEADFHVEPKLLDKLKKPLWGLMEESLVLLPTIWNKRRLESWLRNEPIAQLLHIGDIDQDYRDPGSRFTLEELFRQYAAITRQKVERARKLEDTYGVDPGRQWQEQAYTVTHSIGNAVFAVETYLDCLHDMLDPAQFPDILDNVDSSLECIEKAKKHLFRFKQIARYDELDPEPVDLRPRLESSLGTAKAEGIRVELHVHDDEPVLANPDDLDELFDEIVANSLYWVRKSDEEPMISATVKRATLDALPPMLARTGNEFLWIRYRDSGPGVAHDIKERIFKLSFSESSTGMGYGLALVRKNIRRFGGEIVEDGLPGSGVQFDMFIPLAKDARKVSPSERTQPIPEIKLP